MLGSLLFTVCFNDLYANVGGMLGKSADEMIIDVGGDSHRPHIY